jgi:hypothetical protein
MVVFSTVVPQTSSNISPAKRKQEKKGSKKKKINPPCSAAGPAHNNPQHFVRLLA